MGDGKGVKEIIDLSKSNIVDGIYIYDFDDLSEMDNMIMGQVYRQAFKVIGKIAGNIGEKTPDNKRDCDSSHGSFYRQRNTIGNYSNIIPLIGNRGTGKTSALETITRYLQNPERDAVKKRNELMFGKANNLNSPVFTVLDCIDADKLSEKDSIFENVIMRMYKKYEEKTRQLSGYPHLGMGYSHRPLASKFEEVLRSYSYKKTDGGAVIQELRDASARVNLCDRFKELVDELLAFLYEKPVRGINDFLVIPIDDLDTNVYSAYVMMEEIHQYLMRNNIIVVVTIDLTQFSYICENHFSNIVPSKPIIIEESKNFDNDQYWKHYVSVITQNYIDKILPSENRVHLPGIHNENRKVYLKNYEPVNQMDTIYPNQNAQSIEGNGYGEQPAKWVILYKIFRRTGILCDGLGKKKHYYEPDTIRKVVSLVEYLNRMEIVMDPSWLGKDRGKPQNSLFNVDEERIETIESILKVNIESVYKDIVERMEYEKLLPEKRAAFDDIRRQYRSRQHRNAFEYFQNEICFELRRIMTESIYDVMVPLPYTKKQKAASYIYPVLGNLNYSYGNYQFMLNEYSRRMDKKMIHTILALQTANMTSLYNDIIIIKRKNMIANGEDSYSEELEKLFVDLRQVIGDSCSGYWFRAMMRNAVRDGKSKKYENGYSPICGDIEEIEQKMEDDLKEEKEDEAGNNVREAGLIIHLELPDGTDLKGISILIESILILLPEADVKVTILDDKKVDLEIESGTISADGLGFIMWYFDSQKSLKRIRESVSIINKNDTSEENDINKEIKDILNEYCTSCDEAVLPFYSQDVYYNLLKRLKENKRIHFESLHYDFLGYYENALVKQTEIITKTAYDPVAHWESREVLPYAIPYLKVLDRIRILLEKEDDYYKADNILLVELQEKYKSCHYIRNLVYCDGDKEAGFWEMLNLLVIGTIIRQNYTLNSDVDIVPDH